MTSDTDRLIVNITRRTTAAMEAEAERSGDTRTDVVNRAIQLYARIMATAGGPDVVEIVDAAGNIIEIDAKIIGTRP